MKLADVASRAGVSISTVSRVLNGKKHSLVTEATAERVRQVAAEMGYRPSAAAQALVTGRSKAVALCCHPSYDSNSADMVRNVHQITRDAGYHLLLVDSKDMGEIQKLLVEQRVDAAIWTRYPVHNADLLAEYRGAPHQIIAAVGEIDEHIPQKVLSAVWEDREGMRLVLEHLVSLGHQHVAFLWGKPAGSSSKLLAFHHVCAELGLHGEMIYVDDETDRMGAGMNMALEALSLQNRPTALVGRNDDFALGALCALHDAGLSLPEEMSVVGYHNHKESAYSRPSLTTVRTPVISAIDIVLDVVFTALEDEQPDCFEPALHRLSLELVVRTSTAAP